MVMFLLSLRTTCTQAMGKCKYPPSYHRHILKRHLVYRFVPVEFDLVQFPIFMIDQVHSMD